MSTDDSEIRLAIGERLRAERARTGLSQEDFAKAGNVSRRTQVMYESGERQPDAGYLARIASATGANIDFIVTGGPGSVNTLTLAKVIVAVDTALEAREVALSLLKRANLIALAYEAATHTLGGIDETRLNLLVDLAQ